MEAFRLAVGNNNTIPTPVDMPIESRAEGLALEKRLVRSYRGLHLYYWHDLTSIDMIRQTHPGKNRLHIFG